MLRYRLLIVDVVLLLVVLGAHYGRRLEALSLDGRNMLGSLPLPFRGWKTADVALDPSEARVLEPDAVLIRRYTGPSGGAELAVIAGHRKRSIHTPAFCMVGGGWETLWQRPASLRLGGRAVDADQMLMARDEGRVRALVTYFFTDGTRCTGSLVRFQLAQLIERFRARVPIGALVRIIVPVGSDPAVSERLTDEFAAATVPPVLQRLQAARLEPR